jgi:hypothetical protein
MKTLGQTRYRQEISDRLGFVRVDSQRRWGKMNAHQMICHLCDSFRGVTGEKALHSRAGAFRGLMKWGALYVPLKWPRGFQTMPEMDQDIGGTRPVEFEADVRELRRVMGRFTRQPRDFTWRPHPIFGAMADQEWMRWAYLHMDHHLRQFGL